MPVRLPEPGPVRDDGLDGFASDFADVPNISEPIGTFVSLYAGAGGMDLGFALAGFAPVWVNELDRYACETHEKAFADLAKARPHLAGHEYVLRRGSLLDVPLDERPSAGAADLVIGGPPCKGFSVAGKMDPQDERSDHVFHFLDVVKRVQPRAFVMENVKALGASDRWSSLREDLLAEAAWLGYSTNLVICNASHYGVPQARERMLLIGIRGVTPSDPVKTTPVQVPTVRDALTLLPPLGEDGNDSLCTAKITSARNPVMRKSPFAGMLFNGSGRPMDLDAPAPTLPASMGGNRTPIVDQDSLEAGTTPWTIEYHRRLEAGKGRLARVPSRMRRLTVQEAAALQTFPQLMRWSGPRSAQFRQIGNAVPPRLALAAARSVAIDLGLSPS